MCARVCAALAGDWAADLTDMPVKGAFEFEIPTPGRLNYNGRALENSNSDVR